MRQLNNIPELTASKINFWINDIGLFVPPTSISVHKEGLNYSVKSLRTRSSVKMASGNGIYHIQVNLVFPPDSLLQLHRLICQIKNNPFVFIENEFIKKSLESNIFSSNNYIYTTMIGLNVANHPSSPGTFTVELDLRYLNTKVYSEELGFKNDLTKTLVIGNKVLDVSFDIFNSEIINVIKETDLSKGENTIRKIEKKLEKEISEKPNTSIKVLHPKDSSVYKRYCNYLQILYLNKYFNIKIDRKKDTSSEGFICTEETAEIYVSKKLAEDLNKGNVGLHDIFAKGENIKDEYLLRLRQEVIHAMYLTSKFTRIYSRYFMISKISQEDHKIIRKIVDKDIKSTMTKEEKYNKRKENIEKFFSQGLIKTEGKEENQKYKKSKTRNIEEIEIIPIIPGENEVLPEGVLNPFDNSEDEYKENLDFANAKVKSGDYAIVNIFLPVEGVLISKTENSLVFKNETYGEFSFKGDISFNHILSRGDVLNKTYPRGYYIGTIKSRVTKEKLDGECIFSASRKLMIKLPVKQTKDEVTEMSSGEKLTFEKINKLYEYIIESYEQYTGRKEVDNINMSESVLELLDYSDYEINQISNMSEGFLGNDFRNGDQTVIANMSGSLRHICASIPILGQETPTHQFLGSIEPSYQFNLIGKRGGNALPKSMLVLEKIRSNSQYFSKAFSIIPGASFIAIESMITKLLGSYEKYSREIVRFGESENYFTKIIEKYNFSINSMDTYTLDGQPNAVGMNFRFDETRDYNEEEIRPAFRNELTSDRSKKFYDEFLRNESFYSFPKGNKRKLSTDSSLYKSLKTNSDKGYDASLGWGKWKTKHYLPEEYYAYTRQRESNYSPNTLNGYIEFFERHNEDSIHPDQNAYYICKVLSQIQDYFSIIFEDKNKMHIFSSLRYENRANMYKAVDIRTNKTKIIPFALYNTDDYKMNPAKSRSMHYTGGAVDIFYRGKNVTELIIYIYFMQLFSFIIDPLENSGRSKRFLGMGAYGLNAYKKEFLMDKAGGANGFVHLDLNYSVKEISINEKESLYVEEGYRNSLRKWYGKSGNDKYDYSELDIFKILEKYTDPKNLNFSDEDNNKLNSLGFDKLEVYAKRVLDAHKNLNSGTIENTIVGLAGSLLPVIDLSNYITATSEIACSLVINKNGSKEELFFVDGNSEKDFSKWHPASTIKFVAGFLAAKRLNDLGLSDPENLEITFNFANGKKTVQWKNLINDALKISKNLEYNMLVLIAGHKKINEYLIQNNYEIGLNKPYLREEWKALTGLNPANLPTNKHTFAGCEIILKENQNEFRIESTQAGAYRLDETRSSSATTSSLANFMCDIFNEKSNTFYDSIKTKMAETKAARQEAFVNEILSNLTNRQNYSVAHKPGYLKDNNDVYWVDAIHLKNSTNQITYTICCYRKETSSSLARINQSGNGRNMLNSNFYPNIRVGLASALGKIINLKEAENE